ncbi:uracil-DNA glycosylase family protein [Ramlibacter cellulosilyticus]|nr:uracil-DNA glycosylase family protein [Ramlibacter cellulosilyticus]
MELDPRQRAMLEEMGIRLFWPESAPVEVEEPVLARAQPAVEVPVARPRPDVRVPEAAPVVRPAAPAVPAGTALPGIDLLAWDPAARAVRGPVDPASAADLQGGWLVLCDASESEGEPAMQAARLLDGMLAALALPAGEKVCIARVPAMRASDAGQDAVLRRPVALLRPKIILAMGRASPQVLLQTTEPVGKLRGRVHRCDDVPVVVTYPPAYLLRNLPDKAKAWADLVLALSVLRGAT